MSIFLSSLEPEEFLQIGSIVESSMIWNLNQQQKGSQQPAQREELHVQDEHHVMERQFVNDDKEVNTCDF